MKALLTLILLVTSQIAFADSKPTLNFGAANPSQFSFIESEEGDKIVIKKNGSQKPQIINYKTTTIVQTHRMHIELKNSRKEMKSIDLLAVVTTTGDKTQLVEVFIPVRNSDFIITKQISPVCALENWGGQLYTETPEVDFPKLFQVEEKHGRVALNVMVRKNEGAERKMTTCFEVMLNAKGK